MQTINVYQSKSAINVIQKDMVINVAMEEIPMVKFVPFNFIATEGQSIFTLNSTPLIMVGAYVNGVAQTGYSRSGKVLTLTEALSAGDVFFGIYQEA